MRSTSPDQPNDRAARRLDRRQFLVGVAGMAVSGAVVSACGSGASDDAAASPSESSPSESSPTSTHPTSPAATSLAPTTAETSGSTAAGPTPAYMPFTGVAPDIPAGDHGVPAGYQHYPANPPRAFTDPAGSGGKVTMMLQGNPPAAKGKNPWWQALNSLLNVDLDFQITMSSQYHPKFQVAVAGDQIADVTQVDTAIQNLPEVLDKYFADLTDLLSGDAVAKYPGLASIPTAAWQAATVNGRIWGVPQARPPSGSVLNVRVDLLPSTDGPPTLGSGQDFLDLCAELSDPQHNWWAFGQQPTGSILPGVLEMMQAPNQWQEKDGAFTSVNESPEMKDALDVVARMWQKQYIHPDVFASPSNSGTWWRGGRTVLYFQSFANWPRIAQQNPDWHLNAIVPPKWDGGGVAPKALSLPAYGAFVGFKKAKADRVQELLRVASYLAAPFGSAEYLTVNYGVADRDYKLDGSDPVPTDVATSDMGNVRALAYVASQQYSSLYMPGDAAQVQAQHDYLAAILPTGVSDPTQGLYSATALGDGATAQAALTAVQGDIIQGRKKVSDWDAAVKTWRAKAGQQVAKEYAEAYAAAH
jgi:putative aldouronate transport system substrate-binding protein